MNYDDMNDISLPILEQYENSIECSCELCQVSCRACPGVATPQDIRNIVKYSGTAATILESPKRERITIFDTFLLDHFQVEDIEDAKINDKIVCNTKPGVIKPSQRINGTCVFFDQDTESCDIHPVAPFGCRKKRECDPIDVVNDTTRTAKLEQKLSRDKYYQLLCRFIRSKGGIAPKQADSKRVYDEMVDDLTESEGNDE
tara:strand:- start:183 stop:785 length:603 start_codon:yes stop_codon:yes gene_type:complete